MTKKEAIQRAIFERAYELEQKAREYRGTLLPKENISWQDVSGAALKKALKKAVQEWNENKPVFDLSFLNENSCEK